MQYAKYFNLLEQNMRPFAGKFFSTARLEIFHLREIYANGKSFPDFFIRMPLPSWKFSNSWSFLHSKRNALKVFFGQYKDWSVEWTKMSGTFASICLHMYFSDKLCIPNSSIFSSSIRISFALAHVYDRHIWKRCASTETRKRPKQKSFKICIFIRPSVWFRSVARIAIMKLLGALTCKPCAAKMKNLNTHSLWLFDWL